MCVCMCVCVHEQVCTHDDGGTVTVSVKQIKVLINGELVPL